MASIVKRRKKYSVVYQYTDSKGKKHQKWETFSTMEDARKRKIQIEYQQTEHTFIIPECKTVNELLDEYMSLYGVNKWAMSTYESNKSLLDNYVRPVIGKMKLDSCNTLVMDKYFKELLKMKAVRRGSRKASTEHVTIYTAHEIYKVLRNAFNQALKWELINRNPVEHVTLPKAERHTRDIWDADTLFHAIELCEDETLKLALNLSFACSLRMGEMLGLTWDCIDITPEAIEEGKAYVFVEKELQRVSRDAVTALEDKDIMRKFPHRSGQSSTMLVLKKPKTKTSTRKVFLPKTVAEMLIKRKEEIEELKYLFGDEYEDNGLVFCNPLGHPLESGKINRSLDKLIKDHNLPRVVFHSLRHSSITYKLKLNGGDMKSVQGDSGHSQLKMVADVYSHIIDDDRRFNAQKMEEAFYSGKKESELEGIKGVKKKEELSDQELLLKLLQKPEMVQLLKSLAENLK